MAASTTMAMIDGAMVNGFVDDEVAFNLAVDELFTILDSDGDGLLSRPELMRGFAGILAAPEGIGNEDRMSPTSSSAGEEEREAAFARFGDGAVGKERFREEMRQIMQAVATGIGGSPVQVGVFDGSCGGPCLFTRVVQHSHAKAQQPSAISN